MDKAWLPTSIVAQAFETGAWGAPSESLNNYENHRKQEFNIMKSAAEDPGLNGLYFGTDRCPLSTLGSFCRTRGRLVYRVKNALTMKGLWRRYDSARSNFSLWLLGAVSRKAIRDYLENSIAHRLNELQHI